MKKKLAIIKLLWTFFIGIDMGMLFVTLNLGSKKGIMYYRVGFIILAITLILTLYFYRKQKRLQKIIYLQENWPYGDSYKKDFNKINKLFYEIGTDFFNEKDTFVIDDQTASDLNLREVFSKIDSTITTAGQQMLYYMLRTLKLKEKPLKERDKIIDLFIENSELRGNVQVALSNLGKQNSGQIINLFNTKKVIIKSKKYVYNLLASMPIIVAFSFSFLGTSAFIYLFLVFAVNGIVHYRATSEMTDEVNSIAYLGRLISCAKEISNLKNEELKKEIEIIKKSIKPFKNIDRKSLFLSEADGIDVFIEYINVLFLNKIRAYYSIVETIENNREDLINLYAAIGRIDSYVCIAAYRERIENYSKPEFVEEKQYISIENGIHPLVENCVANSITLNKKGVILTGSNMAGKSTFLRTLGLNILLSQTIYTTLSDNYKGSFFRLLTSLSVSDDVNEGRSYYLGECEALLRILKSIEYENTTFCMIDEIFRGTNPIERIASSKEIIKYIMGKNSLGLIATHDLELTEVSKDKYDCYYFCEDVDEENGLKFDYELKKGVCESGNAIKLLKYLGYPEEIINGAKNTVKAELKIIENK